MTQTSTATQTPADKLGRLEARAALALPRPGPAAEFVQTATGVIGTEVVTVRIVNGQTRYETYAEGMRQLTRTEVLAAIAPEAADTDPFAVSDIGDMDFLLANKVAERQAELDDANALWANFQEIFS